MAWVVFLRAVNVGGTNRCQPALIAKELAKFDIVNIGAVGTFVVRKNVSESALRAALQRSTADPPPPERRPMQPMTGHESSDPDDKVRAGHGAGEAAPPAGLLESAMRSVANGMPVNAVARWLKQSD